MNYRRTRIIISEFLEYKNGGKTNISVDEKEKLKVAEILHPLRGRGGGGPDLSGQSPLRMTKPNCRWPLIIY